MLKINQFWSNWTIASPSAYELFSPPSYNWIVQWGNMYMYVCITARLAQFSLLLHVHHQSEVFYKNLRLLVSSSNCFD